ncbi:flagellar protein FlgN [Bacillus sp. 03113]|uniref:flagellar protein FlgN n=1 Tax=Bacillus sp. 03113 TaxID=2578211 RepID=UPI00215CD4A8|nr:flagellar protein FlgN [Bacillus sp. 03113]
MTAEKLIHTLEKLLKLHQSLLELSIKKTEWIKQGDIDSLKQIMKDEQVHIAAIQKLEQVRMDETNKLCPALDRPSVQDCLSELAENEQTRMKNATSQLTDVVFKIKDQNTLNQQLLHQSMQFIHFSLSLFQPVKENFNYERTAQKTPIKSGSSLFNSKA